MNGRCFFVAWILMLGVCFPAKLSSQVDSSILAMADWVKAYNHFGKYNPQEKVYLHFDNTGYYLGETMWFAAYVVTAPQLRPTQMSKVLYVELLTPEGRIVETKKLKIEGGRCHGEFALTSPLLVAGFYEVRAYTRVMLNWEGSYYTRVFPVFDRPEEAGQYAMKITRYPRSQRVPEERAAAPDYKSLNLSFYPEGGELVEGLPGRVAFKAVDDEGRSVAVSGTVYDSDERPVATLETRHQGMGSFTLTPGSKPCRAEITYNGKTYRYTLPEAKAAGYTLGVDNSSGDSLHIKIRRSRDIQGGWVGLTVSCRGIAHAFEIADLRGQEEAELHLSKAELSRRRAANHALHPRRRSPGRAVGLPSERRPSAAHHRRRAEKQLPSLRKNHPAAARYRRGGQSAIDDPVGVGARCRHRDTHTLHQHAVGQSAVGVRRQRIHRRHRILLRGRRRRTPGGTRPVAAGAGLAALRVASTGRRGTLRARPPGRRGHHGTGAGLRLPPPRCPCQSRRGTVGMGLFRADQQPGHCFTDSLGRFTFLSDSDIWGKNDMVIQTQITNKRGERRTPPTWSNSTGISVPRPGA